MEPDDLLTKFTKLKVKRKGGQAAFHKPLLALWAIGRCLRREPRLAPFAVVDQELEKLLRRFGPAGQSLHTQEPFWRLKNDGVWEVRDEERVPLHPDGASGYRAYRKDLLRLGIQGGLKQEVYEAFARNPELARRVAQAMLAKYLPNEPHGEIIAAVGLERSRPSWPDGEQRADLRQRFQTLQVWKRKDERTPHKPLLALWAIGRCLRGERRMAPFDLADRELTRLLRRFGPHRPAAQTQEPFWRMRKDGVWEIDPEERVPVRPGGRAYRNDLLAHNIHGGLREDDFAALRNDPRLAVELGRMLVAAHFPPTRHAEVLEATGIGLGERSESPGGGPDAQFRRIVLEAYNGQCAVCAFALRAAGAPRVLDAVHIKWIQAGGPNSVRNGLSLCALHQRLFEGGVFTLTPRLEVVVARTANDTGSEEWLNRFDRKYLRVLPRDHDRPSPEFLTWHGREVFQSPEVIG